VSVTTSKISDDDHKQHEALVRNASKATGWIVVETLDVNYLYRDQALAESAIRKLERGA
jgi:hypothetical protein